ncbi:MAG: hypothetical protein A2Y75_05405 [Candidatus Solincola sediminis]|uniref:Major capsid protein n=1 Tax=Candidatus Solincola sediminis TaxID=1797199 RepID=A0A1F2WG50_9ACTN|nr:MAG: hypothetical protein A2Y75_05405 [Candidatus Solincola sediminis]
MGKKTPGPVQIPSDLSALTGAELDQLETAIHDEFGELDEISDDDITTAQIERMAALADGVEAIRGDRQLRTEAAQARAAERESLRTRLQSGDATEDTDGGDDSGDAGDADGVDAEADTGARTPALVAGGRGRTDVRDVLTNPRDRLNVRLSAAKQHQTPDTRIDMKQSFGQTVLVASADLSNFGNGAQMANMDDLVSAMTARARSLPDSRNFAAKGDWTRVPRYNVAQLRRQFRYNLDITSKPEDAWALMQEAANPESLVAAGGWCSPSEISYDFYNIVATDGMLDLPTTGIRRGGMRWPTSPSFGDLASSTGLWHWNETQDIAAATGTAQSGSKTCARVPCASFNEARLEGEGICITAGNLTTDAWPEQIANFMRLVNAAHAHRVNAFMINRLVALSTSVTVCPTGVGAIMPILDAIEMQATDLRTKYAMMDGAVMEAVFPSWVFGLVRADLAKRNGLSVADAFGVTNAQIGSWFSLRGISAQFVQDWQVRTTGFFGNSAAITSWPTQVQFLMYPAGTFVRGNGLMLDLGVIRDSTLNATNDYTAAWSEEFFLVAMIGHESRVITVPLCPNGATAALQTFACTTC